ncbi:hypothetical protein F0562_003476 [Nyssa sinensis]|uniref:SWIM-type domain-containing protein n=1 Tax=Nyssa sinensis TaxID=561372 RepID=A0A5J5BZF7_9ASTE|nr:hypothetical protein F0562_003476 [Nyssa sinensis]
MEIKLYCDVPAYGDLMCIQGDKDVLTMFEIHWNRKIDIYVETNVAFSCPTKKPQLIDYNRIFECLVDACTGDEEVEHDLTNGDEMCVDDKEVDTQNNDDKRCDDDIYGLSSEDEDLSVETKRGSGKKDANSGFAQQDDLQQDYDDELSNYESENEIDNFSSSDLDLEDNECNAKKRAKQKIKDKVFDQSSYGIEFQYDADGAEEFQIIDENEVHCVVDLATKSCVCKEWKISGIPCKHVTAAIAYKRVNIEEYCDSKYTKEIYLATHSGMIHNHC